MKKRKPICFVIAGPNGAGKTTFAVHYLPQIANCHNYINADMIAYALSPFDVLASQYDAGRIYLQEIHNKIDKKEDFAFETTLAGRSHISLFKKLKQSGWIIILIFLWIPDAAFSRNRIRERVRQGGHDIPDDAVYRRYPRVIHNFMNYYLPLCDTVYCCDNSGFVPEIIFEYDEKGMRIVKKEIYENIIKVCQ